MPEPADLSTPAAYAQAYARLGWHVFPLKPQAKEPFGRLVPRGMLDATLDADTIAKWWRAAPNAGIGIALAPSGLVALDIDPRNGGTETFDALQADHGSLRSEVMAFTGGGGEHHVFVIPPGSQVSLPGTLGPGVDVKANGYIVVEPSIHPSGKRYDWEASSSPLDGVAPSPLPDWLRSLRVELRRQEPREGDVPVDAAAARDAREALYMLDADSREDWLHAGMALHSTGWGHPAYAMWSAWAQQSTKFDSTDQRKTWESFKAPADRGAGLTLAWIFGQAQAQGWVNPRARVERPASTPEALPGLSRRDDEREEAEGLPFLSLAELEQSAAAVSWVVKHTIPAESVGILFGGSGTFKTYLALDLALHVCRGMPWLGKKTTEGPALYIAAEGGTGLWSRIKAWHQARNLKPKDSPLYVVPVAIDVLSDCSRVVEAAAKAGVMPSLIVVDTLSQTFSGEENSANEVAAYLRELGTMFRQTWQCAVVVVHHSGHQATERPRGSSAIRANVDFMLGVFRDEKEMVATVECQKQKDGERFEDVAFALSSVNLGTDEDGEPVTQLSAAHVRTAAELTEVVREQAAHGRKGYHATLIEIAKDGMKEKELRSAFYEACDLGTSDSKSKAYRRVMQWATNGGFIGVINGEIRIFSRL